MIEVKEVTKASVSKVVVISHLHIKIKSFTSATSTKYGMSVQYVNVEESMINL